MFSNLSPSSSINELSLSPYLCSPNSLNEIGEQPMSNIQFSPSIKNENSDEESMDEQNESDEQKDNETTVEKFQEISNSKLGN